MGVYGKNTKIHNRTRLLSFKQRLHAAVEGVPVQTELVDVVMFFLNYSRTLISAIPWVHSARGRGEPYTLYDW